MVHGSSAYLFCDDRIEVPFKCGSEFVIVGYRRTRARDEVDALSGNNVEKVMQVPRCS